MSTNSGYKLATRLNPCPVCGATKDCKELLHKTQLTWFCREHVTTAKGDKVPGVDGQVWYCFGEVGGGVWGQLSPDSKQKFSPQDKAKHDVELARKRIEDEKRRQEALAREMSAGDRHRHFEKILGELGLRDCHQHSLVERGFASERIEAIGFRSVDKWQSVGDYPENLPGYSADRKNLIIPRPGILCPVPNYQGLTVGWQVRFDEVADGENRYMWAKGAHINGESPIACWDKQLRHSDEIWAIEGTGIKPALAHFKFGYPVIGASGGLFESSAKNFRETWEFLKSKHNTNKLVVAVDGGDVVNLNVVNRLKRQFNLFKKLNIDVSVAWWGQVYKDRNDIDEIANLDSVNRISIEEFWAILKQYKVEREKSKKVTKPEPIEPERDTLSGISRQDNPSTEEESDPAKQKWHNSRKLTPNHEFCSKYVEFREPEEGELLGISSPVGTGKTEYFARLLNKENGVFKDKKVVSFYSRNNLIVNVIKRVDGLIHLNDERSLMVKDLQGKLALCTNSIKKFTPEDFDGAVIVIDEIESVMSHILCSKTHRSDRVADLKLFGEALTRAYCVLVMDGNLTDKTMDWLATKTKGKKIVKVKNTLQPKRSDVELFVGTPTKSGKYNSNKLSAYVAPMIANEQPFLVLSDSQAKLEQIEKLLIEAGKKGIRLDSKTLDADSEEKRCLADIKLWVEENKPDYLMGSPAIGLGVDITNFGYFKDSYIVLVGVLGTDDQMQLAGRCRDTDVMWHMSCPQKSQVPSDSVFADYFEPAKIAQKLVDYAKQDLSYLKGNLSKLGNEFLKWVEEAKDNSDAWYALLLNSKEKYEKDNLRDCLIAALKGAGHKVTKVSGAEVAALEAMLKTAKEEIKEQTSKEIFQAADITEEEAEKKAKSWSCTWDERKEVIKASYKKMLPGIEKTEHWTQDLIHYLKWDNAKAISQANLLHLFHNPHLAEKVQVNTWARIASEGQVFLPDLRSQNLKVECLKFLNLEQFLNPEAMWHKDSPELVELADKAARPRAIAALGIKPPRDNRGAVDRMDFLRRLLELVGLKLGKCQKRRIEAKVTNCYRLDSEWLVNLMWIAIGEAVARRYEAFEEKWVQPEVFTEEVAQMSVPEPEPETDADGVDWRGVLLEVQQAVGHLIAGDRVEGDGQPRDNGAGGWLIWVKTTIGRLQLDFEMLQLAFD